MKITFSLTASSFYKIPHPSSTPLLTDSLLILHHRRLSPLHRRSRSSITPLPQSLSFSFNADEFRYLLHAVFCRCSLKLVSVVAAAATSSSRRRWFSDRYGKLSVNELPSFFSSLFLPYDCLLLWRITFYTLMIKNPDKLSSKSVGVKDGVVFSTYISLIASSDKGQSRLKQLVQWCGPKFDGLIIFDECHKAKNLMPEAKGGMQPTQTGKAVLDMPEACKASEAVEYHYVNASDLNLLEAHEAEASLAGRGAYTLMVGLTLIQTAAANNSCQVGLCYSSKKHCREG
ncbi:uncharacterized protein [Arachis hypogaea]|uniref:uncharacterized protein isoform X1 n=1 Tax=Arachis hypogaea TaxID=3818 RepID=UPI003B222311